MRKPVFITALFSALLVAALGRSQAAPNFSGDWKMNIVKSDFGRYPAIPELLTRTIRQNGVVLEYSTRQKGTGPEHKAVDVTTELKYTTDGKVCANKVNGSDAKGTAKFQGGNLVIESTREIQDLRIASKEVWTLSEDGKVLTINNHVSIPQQGDFDIKLVLDKQ
jgi:hypothetical protein